MAENREELRYETKDIQLVMVNDEEAVKYQVYTDGKEIHQFKRDGQNIESVSMTGITAAAYLDVTQDGVKDIVVIGEPPRGTLTGPHWIYLYDMENRKIISAFDESGALTEKQLDEIGKHLGKEFYETFPESKSLEACKQWGQPYVDKFGQLYYQTSIAGENPLTDIGEMLVMFSYDTLKESFEVCDVIYMPRFVEEEYDYANER